MKQWKEQLGQWRSRFGSAGLLLVGFALGALVFGVRSCGGAPEPAEHAHSAAPESSAAWTCSMHPQIRQPEAGKCPICGMDLIPVDPAGGALEQSPNRVVLSERAQALAKLRTTPVHRQADAASQLRLLGRIEANEAAFKSVTAWTGGRIDRLHVRETGQRVGAGQTIATLYSPEVFAAHQDLLVARGQLEKMAESPDAVKRAAAAALDAARQRLRLLGVPDDDVGRMETAKQPTRAVAIRSPFSGTVIERMATEGAYIQTGTPLYRVADLKTVWVQLDAYETDLPRISEGLQVRLTTTAVPDEEFAGSVTFIDPTLDPKRRTARVRVEVNNQERRLRPGMFVEATVMTEVKGGDSNPLVVPASAPLFTGQRAIVYVQLQVDGRTVYEARTVRLGPKLGEFYPVVAGLQEGERVVTRGAFSIDADLQIRGGKSMMTAADDRSRSEAAEPLRVSAKQRKRFSPVVVAYLAMQEGLAADDLAKARDAGKQLTTAVDGVKLEGADTSVTSAWAALAEGVRKQARQVEVSQNLEGARASFEALSLHVRELLRRFGNPLDEVLRVAFCPMAAGSEGASWVQRGSEIDNSYFGAQMRTCGEIQQQVGAGALLETEAPQSGPETQGGGHPH